MNLVLPEQKQLNSIAPTICAPGSFRKLFDSYLGGVLSLSCSVCLYAIVSSIYVPTVSSISICRDIYSGPWGWIERRRRGSAPLHSLVGRGSSSYHFSVCMQYRTYVRAVQ